MIETEYIEQRSSKRNGGGDRTRTCKTFRSAVFKTAALPIMRPLQPREAKQYNSLTGYDKIWTRGNFS